MSSLTTVVEFTFWISLAVIIYIYAGYGWVLHGLRALRGKRTDAPNGDEQPLPFITVLLTVFNEEKKLRKRLDNLVSQDYPPELIAIVVASDGSTDNSDHIVRDYAARHRQIRLVQSGGRMGKSTTQNIAIATIDNGVIALTDADTVCSPDYLRRIGECFLDPSVGCVTANLEFLEAESDVSQSQGYYWNYELKLRRLESDLGLLAVASGQAMAVRKEYFVELPADVGDDCIIPLDTVLRKASVRFCEAAKAFDIMEHNPAREFHTRVRMTLRNWNGTWRHPQLLNPLRHPGYAFALWSHKLLRWLGGPIFLVFLLTGLGLGLMSGAYSPIAYGLLALITFALAGWLGEHKGFHIPLSGTAFSFFLANAGFTAGLWKALRGHRIVTYRSGQSSIGQ